MRKSKIHLWTRDFSCITLASALSIIGGEAMNLPISLLVFDQTGSTLASALIMICGMLPDVILPIFVAPLIDRSSKKSWIVTLDLMLAGVYVLMGWWISSHPFSFGLYLAFTLVVATISVFYGLAYGSWYPDLIPVGAEQKGYAVSGTMYPVITVIMAPVAALLYEKVPMHVIFYVVAGMVLFSVAIEGSIRNVGTKKTDSYTFTQYKTDLGEGFRYLKREKGVRNICCYMAVTNGASNSVGVLTQAFFQTSSFLSVTMFGLLSSAEMIGRTLGGLIQYKVQIPVKKRFAFTKFVYSVYNAMDACLLFLPYPAMLVNRFLCGALGVSSATIRESAMNCYLKPDLRARVNALCNVVFALGSILCHLGAGLLGQVMDYRLAVVLITCAGAAAMIGFIFLRGEDNRPVYEATREEHAQA